MAEVEIFALPGALGKTKSLGRNPEDLVVRVVLVAEVQAFNLLERVGKRESPINGPLRAAVVTLLVDAFLGLGDSVMSSVASALLVVGERFFWEVAGVTDGDFLFFAVGDCSILSAELRIDIRR